MRCSLLASALLFAPLLVNAAPAPAAEAAPQDDPNPYEPAPDPNARVAAGAYVPSLPPYPRGYTWRDCTIMSTTANRLHWKRDDGPAPDAPAPGSPVPAEPVVDTSFPEDALNFFPPTPTEEIVAPPRPDYSEPDQTSAPEPAVTARNELQRRKGTCSVSNIWYFERLAHADYSSGDYVVQAGRNLAFSVASNIVIQNIQLYYEHAGRFILGPQIRPNLQSAVLNWHASLTTTVYYIITFARAGASGDTRLINSAPA